MNTVRFYRLKGGKVEERRVKVGQPSYSTIIQVKPGQRKDPTPRRPTVAEAEDRMLREGWSRKKPKLPAEMRKAA